MTNEGYRKRVEEWEKTQKNLKDDVPPEIPYDPGRMRSRAPWGCIVGTVLFVIAVVYMIGAAAGFWKSRLF